MSYDTALAEARVLREALQDYGVRVSIELQIGRPWPGDDWYTRKYLRMHHHTVSHPSMGPTPVLKIVKVGRSDVSGPLANGYGGYDLVYRILCMGLANHPGRGGPITIDGVTVPRDSARPSTWGTEWEGGIELWTDEFLEFMGKSDNALADWMGRPDTSQMEHSTWAPTRKVDRLGFDREKGIALTKKYDRGNVREPRSEQEEKAMPFLVRNNQKDSPGYGGVLLVADDLKSSVHVSDTTSFGAFQKKFPTFNVTRNQYADFERVRIDK